MRVRSVDGYQIWLPGRRHVYVVEIDPAEFIKKRCLGQSTAIVSRRSLVILRYWVVEKWVYFGKTENSSGRKALLRAHQLIGQLQRGDNIKPDFERRARESCRTLVDVSDTRGSEKPDGHEHEHDHDLFDRRE